MADNIKQDFQYFDIPDGQGGYERKWCKDAEARAAIAQLDPASAASDATCEDIIDDIVDGTTKTQGHETEVIPVSGLKAALDKYKNDVTDEGLSGKQDTISDLATIRSGAQAGATAYQKPNGGIPKTDLASAVQTSLGRADTALQEHQDITGKVDKTTTVNGHALSGNVSVTKSDVGLGNVTNDSQVKRSEMGAASGVATLDSTGKVPSSQLPSYVDDVLEYETKSAFPTTGESGKIYVDKSTDTTWRWSGTTYTQIKGDLAIGTTTGTAADGGTASDHYSNTSNPHSVTKSQVGLGSVVNTGDSATPVSGGTTKFTTGGAYTELAKKVDKVTGKGLSTNDYTTDEKNKLAGIAAGAEVNVQSDWNATEGDAFIKNKPTIPAAVTESTVSGWGFTKNAGTITGIKMNGSSKGTSGVVDLGTVITAHQDISGKVNTTTTVNGHALSSNVTVTKSDVGLGSVGNFKAVSTVASQGLTDTEKSNARANIGAGTSSFSGSYNDLSNKPTIPAAANNGTYTIKTLVGSTTTNVSDFTANQSSADDVTFVQGSNVTITPDATNRKITIAATDTKYTAATAAPGKVASSSAQGSSTNYARQDHTHGIDLATGDSNGQVKIAGTNVSVKGLGSAAYTASSAYAASQELARDANLNNIKTVGFYNAGGSNTITNKPSGVEHFGMEVIHYASGDYYVQIVYNNSKSWRRRCDNGTWGSWVQDKLTDTTYSNKSAASGGTDVSLVTTGEKYTWNDKQSKVGKLGSTSKPVYTSAAGTFAECSTYAGGTAVTLNGAGKGGTTASFYAPTSVGTSGQVLVSSGSGAPSWASVASVATCEAIVSELT